MKIDYNKKGAYIVTSSKSLVDKLLEKNKNNRNLKKSHIKWIKSSIESNEFILTGQGISVSENDILLDGQHRLLALKEAGYPPVELLIVTGLEEKSKIYVDQHAKRSTTNMLKICLDHTITNQMTAIINMHMKLEETKEEGIFIVKQKPNLTEVLKEMKRHEKFLSMIVSASGEHARAGVRCALFHFGLKYDKDDAVELAESVANGERLTKLDPAYKLRGYILGKLGKRFNYGGTGMIEDYKHAVACCIAYANGRKMETLRPVSSWAALPKK